MSEVMNVEKIFGEQVFTLGKMKERLPKKVFAEVKEIMEHGGEMSLETADVVAKAMKDWAVENGATHYTHWFQPLTGITAEKHDAFITNPDKMGKMMHDMARNMQVMAITHLPQVAAKGDAHFKVFKRDEDARTITMVTPLSPEMRVREIAAMISGSEVSEQAISAAKALLTNNS